MNLGGPELAALDSVNAVRTGVFLRIDTSPIARLWLGIGKIDPGVNALDETGDTYLGFGELVDIPEFEQLLNGAAQRVEFTLSGVSEKTLGLVNTSAVKNKQCALGIGLMDANWQLIGPVRWLRYFIGDFVSVRHMSSDNLDAPMVRQVSLSAGSQMTGRRRPGLAYYTDQDQQRRSPGDRFCERVSSYRQEVTKVWPRF